MRRTHFRKSSLAARAHKTNLNKCGVIFVNGKTNLSAWVLSPPPSFLFQYFCFDATAFERYPSYEVLSHFLLFSGKSHEAKVLSHVVEHRRQIEREMMMTQFLGGALWQKKSEPFIISLIRKSQKT